MRNQETVKVMRSNSSRTDLVGELDKLIESELLDYDLIVPIARRGVRTLELSSHSDSLFDQGRVLFYDSLRFHSKDIRGKSIVLFDESVRTGKSLQFNRNDLRNSLDGKRNLETAALLVHDTAEYLPRHYPDDLVCNESLYETFSDDLISLILSDGKPLDIHHPIFRIRIPEEAVPAFLGNLEELFASVTELEHSMCFGDTRLLTIDFQNEFEIPLIEEYPHLMDDGPKKVRLFMKRNTISCVPIVYPCLDVSEERLEKRNSCILREQSRESALCEIVDGRDTVLEDYRLQSSLCYTCVMNELCCLLMGRFLRKLDEGVSFDMLGLEKMPLQATYHNEAVFLEKAFEKKVQSIRKGFDHFLAEYDSARKCVLPQIDTVGRDHLLRLRPEMEVALGIWKNLRENDRLFTYTIFQPGREPKRGLSYRQCASMMEEMGGRHFSEGMDIGLDVGYLKPFNLPEGIDVEEEGHGEVRANVRLYGTASEHVQDSLEIFSEFVLPKEAANEG